MIKLATTEISHLCWEDEKGAASIVQESLYSREN